MSTSSGSKRNTSPLLVMGIDPGTGVSSPTGVAVFDPLTRDVIYTTNLFTKHRELQHRIKDISDQLEGIVTLLLQEEVTLCIFIESFVMRGKGGETLQRLIGSFMGRMPYEFLITHIQNVTVKKIVAGHGHAEKEEVAAGIALYFKGNTEVEKLVNRKEFDIIDALAIGVAGWEIASGSLPSVKKGSKSKRK